MYMVEGLEVRLEGTKQLESSIRKWDFLKVLEAEEWLDWASICTDYDGVHLGNDLKTTVQINMMAA